MLKIETEPMKNTINIIPRTIPSNKETFKEMKIRERKAETHSILKENMVYLHLFQKIIDKLENADSEYNTRTLSHQWKENMKHRDILVKKGINSVI